MVIVREGQDLIYDASLLYELKQIQGIFEKNHVQRYFKSVYKTDGEMFVKRKAAKCLIIIINRIKIDNKVIIHS